MWRLRTYFLVTGIPFGLVAGLSFRSYLKYNWLLIAVCALLLGVAYGLIVTGIACLFSRFMGPSGCVRVVLIGLMGIVGLVSGGVLGYGSGLWVGDRLPAGNWREIGHLPEKPVEILAADYSEVYVRAEEDSTYVCRYHLCRKEDLDPKRLARIRSIGGTDLIDPLLPPVPGKVILSYEFEEAFEVVFQYNYVILEDGSLWMWKGSRWYRGYDNLIMLGGSGLSIGLAASLLGFRKNRIAAA